MSKKLLQINVCYNVYSTGKIVENISQLAIKNGWDSYVAYGRTGRRGSANIIKIGSKIESILHYVESSIFDNTTFGIGSSIATWNLIKRIKRLRPDIIHIHVASGYYLNLGVLGKYLENANIPIIWTLHSCWEFTGHCTHFDYQACYKWKSVCEKCPLKGEYPKSYLFDRSSRNFLKKKSFFSSLKNIHIVAVSAWLRNQAVQSFLGQKHISVIYNGVNLDIFKPHSNPNKLKNKYGVEDKFVAICAASTWVSKKGFNDYMKLSSLLPDDIVIFMVGINRHKASLLPHNIVAVEKTTNIEQMVELYNMADVVLNLSYEETFGLTTVEGFACGTPSIVYDRTASPELVSDETGFVIKAGYIEGVLKSIQEIKKRGRLIYNDACRRRAEQLFDKNKNFSKYIDMYESLLARNELEQ